MQAQVLPIPDQQRLSFYVDRFTNRQTQGHMEISMCFAQHSWHTDNYKTHTSLWWWTCFSPLLLLSGLGAGLSKHCTGSQAVDADIWSYATASMWLSLSHIGFHQQPRQNFAKSTSYTFTVYNILLSPSWIYQRQQRSALGKHGPPPRRIWSRFRVSIMSPDLENFQNLNGSSMSKDASTVKHSSNQLFNQSINQSIYIAP